MPATKPTSKKWSQHVTATSNAMDTEPNLFKQKSAKTIAEAVEHDAATSTRRKSTPYHSAMSMLTFYINRAGKNLSPKQRKVLEDAKDVLRAEFGPKTAAAKKPRSKKPAAKTKTPSRKKTASSKKKRI